MEVGHKKWKVERRVKERNYKERRKLKDEGKSGKLEERKKD